MGCQQMVTLFPCPLFPTARAYISAVQNYRNIDFDTKCQPNTAGRIDLDFSHFEVQQVQNTKCPLLRTRDTALFFFVFFFFVVFVVCLFVCLFFLTGIDDNIAACYCHKLCLIYASLVHLVLTWSLSIKKNNNYFVSFTKWTTAFP